jgi:hypothetical protein
LFAVRSETRLPIALGRGKRVFPDGGIAHRYSLAQTTSYPTGVVGPRYTRAAS